MYKITRNSDGNKPLDSCSFTNSVLVNDNNDIKLHQNSDSMSYQAVSAMDALESTKDLIETGSAIQKVIHAVRNVCLNGSDVMPIKDFGVWMEALKNNESDIIKQVLQIASKEEKNVLLNGQFEYDFKPDSYRRISEQANPNVKEGVNWKRPLMISIGAKAFDVTITLLTDSHCKATDIFIRDYEDCNFLHALVHASKYWKSHEKEFMDLYCKVMKCQPLECRKQLLCAENVDGLRPIEVAILDGQLGMFRIMFNELNVYRFEQGNVGMCYAKRSLMS